MLVYPYIIEIIDYSNIVIIWISSIIETSFYDKTDIYLKQFIIKFASIMI